MSLADVQEARRSRRFAEALRLIHTERATAHPGAERGLLALDEGRILYELGWFAEAVDALLVAETDAADPAWPADEMGVDWIRALTARCLLREPERNMTLVRAVMDRMTPIPSAGADDDAWRAAIPLIWLRWRSSPSHAADRVNDTMGHVDLRPPDLRNLRPSVRQMLADDPNLRIAACHWMRRLFRRDPTNADLRDKVIDYVFADAPGMEADSLPLRISSCEREHLFQKGALCRDLGWYQYARRYFEIATDDNPFTPQPPFSPRTPADYRCHVRAVSGLAQSTMVSRVPDRQPGPTERVCRNQLLAHALQVLLDDGVVRSGDHYRTVDPGPDPSPTGDPLADQTARIRDLIDNRAGAELLLHQEVARVLRLAATAAQSHDPAAAYKLCVLADDYLDALRHGSTTPVSSSVQSFTRPQLLLQLGDADAARSDMTALFRREGLDDLARRFDHHLNSGAGAYSQADVDTDWALIADAFAGGTRKDGQQVIRRVMVLLAAADFLRAMDKLLAALSWYDAMAQLPSPQRLAAYRRCAPLAPSTDPTGGVTLLPDLARHLPLARAMSLRSVLGRAAEGLDLALRVFRYGDRVDDPLEADPMAGSGPVAGVDLATWPEPPDTWPDELNAEIGLALVSTGELGRAEAIFERLAGSHWMPGSAAGCTGLIDVWRHRRSLDRVRQGWTVLPRGGAEARLCDHRSTLGPDVRIEPLDHGPEGGAALSPATIAEIDVARAWAEVQTGRAEIGLALAGHAVEVRPYDISGWICIARALRVLGRHRMAIEVLSWLRDPVGPPPPPVPSPTRVGAGIYLRHKVAIETELGWCFIDLDQRPWAREAFTVALERGDYLSSTHRGMLHTYLTDADRPLSEVAAEGARALRRWLRGAESTEAEMARFDDVEASMLVEQGRLLLRKRRIEAGLDCVDRALAIRRRRARASGRADLDRSLFGVLESLLDIGLVSAALTYGEELSPVDDYWNDRLGVRDWSAAVATASSAVVLGAQGGTLPVVLYRARLALARGHTTAAAAVLDRLIEALSRGRGLSPVSDGVLLLRGIVLFDQRFHDQALTQVERYRSLVADERSRLETEVAARVDRVRIDCSCCRRLDPAWPDPVGNDGARLLEAWTLLARSDEVGNPARKADVSAAEAIIGEIDSSSVDGLHLLAIVETQRQRLVAGESSVALAQQYLRTAIARNPFDARLHRDLAAVGLYADSAEMIELSLARALELDPHDPRAHLLRGVHLYRQRRLAEAAEAFRQAVALDPADWVHHRAHVLSLLANRQQEDAEAAFRYAFEVIRSNRYRELRWDTYREEVALLRSRIALAGLSGLSMADQRRQARMAVRDIDEELAGIESEQGPSERLRIRRARLTLYAGDRKSAEAQITPFRDRARLAVGSAVGPGSGSGSSAASVSSAVSASGSSAGSGSGSGSGSGDELPEESRREVVEVIGRLDSPLVRMDRGELPALQVGALVFAILGSVLLFAIQMVAVLRGDRLESLLPLVAIPLAALALATFVRYSDRVTSVKIGETAVELVPNAAADDLVHVDLDFSASRLLIVSGLSHHRPEVPFHDVEPRFLPPPV